MMNRKAYVLIQVEVGQAASVAEALQTKPGIVAADVVAGPHDLVVTIQGSDADAMARTVFNNIQTIPGVTHTTTYMVVSTD